MIYNRFYSLCIILVCLFFLGCQKNIDKNDNLIIEEYISNNNITAESTTSGLYYVIHDQGFGEKPNISSTVTVSYTGKLTDGTIFDQSGPNGATFQLYNLIQGWQEGIPLLNEGGSAMLIIPSKLGYGSRAIGNIPPNSVLIFDIYLIEVNN